MATANSEQIKAIEHSGGVLLSAGAGSGKTFVLVQHVIYLVNSLLIEDDLNADTFEKKLKKKFSETVLMTFTKKATGEIAIRLKDNFLKLENAYKDVGFNPWTLALKNLDSLTVSTIDGFCLKLIKQGFFLEAPETIEIMSEAKAQEKIHKLYLSWLEKRLQVKVDPILELVLRRESELLASIEDIFSDPSLRTEWRESRKKKFKREDVNQLLKDAIPLTSFSILFEKSINLNDYQAFSKSAWYKTWELILPQLPKELTVENILRLKEVFAQIPRLSGPTKKDNLLELQDYYEGIKELRDFTKEMGEDFKLYWENFDTYILPTYELYQEIVGYIDDHYNDLPGHVFGDLAYIVNQGLLNHEAQTQVQALYQYFIVDEFQDTSFLQFSILEKLTNFDYKRLFCVGDLKQAIYGFRGGELGVFLKLQDLIPQNLDLSNNYRSSSSIIHFNNELFSLLFQKGIGFEGRDFNPVPVVFQKVPETTDKVDGGKLIKLELDVPVTHDENDKLIKLDNFSQNDYEAQGILHSIKKIRESGDEETIAILYRSLGPVNNLLPKLMDAGLSFTAQVKISYHEDPLIGIFKVLIEEVLNTKKNENQYATFLIERYLEILGKKVETSSLKDKIKIFIKNIDHVGVQIAFSQFLFNLGLSNSNYANNLKTIHEFCQEFGHDLSLLWEILNNSDDNYSFDFQFGDRPQNIVIMSAHASKGLEFPHVILGGIHTNGRGRPDYPYLGKIPGSFKWKKELAKASEFKTPHYWFENLLNKHKDFAESKRLFYVASTRAQKSLIWVDFKNYSEHCSRVANSWIGGLRVFEEDLNPRYHELYEKIQKDMVKLKIQTTIDVNMTNRPPFFHSDPLGINFKPNENALLVLSEMSVTRLASISECSRKFYLKNICKLDEDDLQTMEIGEKEESDNQRKEFFEEKSMNSDEFSMNFNPMGRGTQIHAVLSTMVKRNMVVPRDLVNEKDLKAVQWAKNELEKLKQTSVFISEEPIKFRVFGFMMTGIPDLIVQPKDDKNEDQLHKIWDFKTGKRKIEAEINYWFQLYLYAYAQFELKKIQTNQSLELSLLYLDEQQTVSKIVSHQEVLNFVRLYWEKLECLDEINLDHCPRCPYQKLCGHLPPA